MDWWLGFGAEIKPKKIITEKNDLLYVVVIEAVFRKEYNSRERANHLEMLSKKYLWKEIQLSTEKLIGN